MSTDLLDQLRDKAAMLAESLEIQHQKANRIRRKQPDESEVNLARGRLEKHKIFYDSQGGFSTSLFEKHARRLPEARKRSKLRRRLHNMENRVALLEREFEKVLSEFGETLAALALGDDTYERDLKYFRESLISAALSEPRKMIRRLDRIVEHHRVSEVQSQTCVPLLDNSAAANDQPQPQNRTAGDRCVGNETDQHLAVPSHEKLKAEREQRLKTAQECWPRIGKQRHVPFAWVHLHAGVHHKNAYQWKNGKLPDSSTMSKNIERVLQQAEPPPQPQSK